MTTPVQAGRANTVIYDTGVILALYPSTERLSGIQLQYAVGSSTATFYDSQVWEAGEAGGDPFQYRFIGSPNQTYVFRARHLRGNVQSEWTDPISGAAQVLPTWTIPLPPIPTHRASVFDTTFQNVPGNTTGRPITFNSENEDIGSLHSTVDDSRFTLRITGSYTMRAFVVFEGIVSIVHFAFARNGTILPGGVSINNDAGEPTFGNKEIVVSAQSLAKDDYVQLVAYSASSASTSVTQVTVKGVSATPARSSGDGITTFEIIGPV